MRWDFQMWLEKEAESEVVPTAVLESMRSLRIRGLI